jgi:hypothetical protein
LTDNFARRFVIGGIVIIRTSDRYVQQEALVPRDASRDGAPERRRLTMRKIILTILGSALLAASTVQLAAAAEQDKVRKLYRAPVPIGGQFRNTNAYWPAPHTGPDWSRYQNGVESPPAGR